MAGGPSWFPLQGFAGSAGGPNAILVDRVTGRLLSFPVDPVNQIDTYFNRNSYTDGSLIDTTTVMIQLTTTAGTSAGSAVLTFAAVPATIVTGMLAVEFNTAGVIPANTTVLSKTSTTVTLSNNVTGAGVASGDIIEFSNFFPVSGNTAASTGVTCLGTDGNVYVASNTDDANTTVVASLMLSKINPNTKVEIAALKTALFTQNNSMSAGPGPSDYRIIPFVVQGVNYVAMAQTRIKTGGDKVFEIINVDAMASVATSTDLNAGAGINECPNIVVRGPYSTSTSVTLYQLIADGGSPVTDFRFTKIVWDNVTGLTVSLIKQYNTPSDFGFPEFADLWLYSSLYYDPTDGNCIFIVQFQNQNITPEIYYAYLVKVSVVTGSVLWSVPVTNIEFSPPCQINSAESDLSLGDLFFAMGFCVDRFELPPSMLGPNQALNIEIDTSTGVIKKQFTDDHTYIRGQGGGTFMPFNGYWDSLNRKYIYYDYGAGDQSGSFSEGWVIFLPDNSTQFTPWTRTVFNPFCTIGGINYDYITGFARSPLQPNEIYIMGYVSTNAPTAFPSVRAPHALAAYNAAQGTLRKAVVIDTNICAYTTGQIDPSAPVTAGGGDYDPLMAVALAPVAPKLFYYHIDEANPPVSFTTTRWINRVDTSALTIIDSSQTPAAAGATAACWTSNTGPVYPAMQAGPGLLVASGDGSMCFGMFDWEQGLNDYPYVFWNAGTGQTHYGLLSDITGFTVDMSFALQPTAVFDKNSNLFISAYDHTIGHSRLYKISVTGVTLAVTAIYDYDIANFPYANGVQYDQATDEIISFYWGNGADGELSTVHVNATTGTVGTVGIGVLNYLDNMSTNSWWGTWIDSGHIVSLSERNEGQGGIPAAASKGIVNLALLNVNASSYVQGPKESDFGGFLGWNTFYHVYTDSGVTSIWAVHDRLFNSNASATMDLLWYHYSNPPPVPPAPTPLWQPPYIPAYLYEQYYDDDDMQAFVFAYNSFGLAFRDWFGGLNLPIYTGDPVSGPLLDWVAEGLYGLQRPTLSLLSSQQPVGPFNTYGFNRLSLNTLNRNGSGQNILVNDDVFRRIITWHFEKDYGKYFNIRWLKRRIIQFINGGNGVIFDVDQTYQVSVTFGVGNQININFPKGHTTINGGAILNRFSFNSKRFNELDSTFTPLSPIAFAPILKAGIESGVLELPFQFTYTVNY